MTEKNIKFLKNQSGNRIIISALYKELLEFSG